jgi:hypothetical protein
VTGGLPAFSEGSFSVAVGELSLENTMRTSMSFCPSYAVRPRSGPFLPLLAGPCEQGGRAARSVC